MNAEQALVLANASCTFQRPLKYPATLEVRLYGDKPACNSLDGCYEIRDLVGADEPAAIGQGTIVWHDHAAGRPTAIPAAVRAQLQG